MKYKIVPLYSYRELSDEAKERVKQWYLDDPYRSEDLTEQFQESFLRYFFPSSKLDVQWGLSSCQGDGVNIYGELYLIDVLDYIEKWRPEEHQNYAYAEDPRGSFTDKEAKRLRHYIDCKQNDVAYMELPHNQRYWYCIASKAEFAVDMIDALEYWKIRDIDKALICKFEKLCIQIVESMCDEMECYGYRYLYDVDDDEVAETCKANEWYFTATGEFETA